MAVRQAATARQSKPLIPASTQERARMTVLGAERNWPADGITRVPYWIYSDREIYQQEQVRIFRGSTWSFLCLEAELPGPNTWRTANLGEMPVVVTRDNDGLVHAFENRCAHRCSLLCLTDRGEDRRFTCVYHNWTYDLEGNLIGVAFRRGLAGQGGLPADCRPESQAPRKLRVEILAGLVFGTLPQEAPSLEEYLGPEIVARIRRVMKAPVRLLGSYSQMLPSNWKLYVENSKDSYHASLLHTFFTTFRLNRLTQKGGLIINASGSGHVSYAYAEDTGGKEYEQAGLRAAREGLRLEAPELLDWVDEFGDGIGQHILAVFPNFMLHQLRNLLMTRHVIPRGVDRTELVYTAFGFEDDDEAMTERRLRLANLVGPAGFVSMEDGAEQLLEVQQLNARYADALDEGRLDEWPELFTQNGRYLVTTAENFERKLPLSMIYCTSRAMLRDRILALREANIYEAQRYRHITGMPLIDVPGVTGKIRARSSFLVVRIMHTGESLLFASGTYRDRIVRDASESGAKLAERVVVLDSRQIDTLLAIPL
jgi:phenylpropionate dioxygenase-like ring-hydroxylating dioxygenase large terminal subunit